MSPYTVNLFQWSFLSLVSIAQFHFMLWTDLRKDFLLCTPADPKKRIFCSSNLSCIMSELWFSMPHCSVFSFSFFFFCMCGWNTATAHVFQQHSLVVPLFLGILSINSSNHSNFTSLSFNSGISSSSFLPCYSLDAISLLLLCHLPKIQQTK